LQADVKLFDIIKASSKLTRLEFGSGATTRLDTAVVTGLLKLLLIELSDGSLQKFEIGAEEYKAVSSPRNFLKILCQKIMHFRAKFLFVLAASSQ